MKPEIYNRAGNPGCGQMRTCSAPLISTLSRFLGAALLVLLAFTACTTREERQLSALLNRADSLMRTRPDSSLYILNKVEAPSTTSLSMRHALLRADALNKCDSVLPSDTLLRELADWYDRHGTANERMRAHYLLGRCYHDMGEAPRALECYQHAAEQADTTREDCDLYTLRAIYGQMADLYFQQNLPPMEIEALGKCGRIAWKDKDTLTALRCEELLIRPYYLLGDTARVLKITDELNRKYLACNYPQAAAEVYFTAIYIYIRRGNLSKARHLMNIFERHSELFKSEQRADARREYYYYCKGLFMLGCHQLDSAEYYFRRTAASGFLMESCKGLMQVFRLHNSPDSVFKYSLLYEAALDTLHNQNRTESVAKMKALYDYGRYELATQRKTMELERVRGLFIITFILFSMVAFLAYSRHIHTVRLKERDNQLIADRLVGMEAERQRLTELMEIRKKEHEQIINQLNETHHEDLQRSLGQLQEEFNRQSEEMREEATQLSSMIETLKKQLEPYRLRKWKDSMYKNDSVKYFMEFRSPQCLLNNPGRRDWICLEKAFEQYFPNFVEMSKTLTDHEKRVFMLLELGIPNKNIAALLHVTSPRVTQLKKSAHEKVKSISQ